jgi:hypothetical protein
MLYKIVALAAFVVSADALRIDASGMSRRAIMGKAAALAPALIAAPAFAELKRAEDAEVYKRADNGKLNAARVIERAKTGDLVDGSSATCAELDILIETDREAIEFEKDKLEGRFIEARGNKGKVEDIEKKLQGQVNKLKKIRLDKGCSSAQGNLKQATDFEVYKRADEGVLNSARVIDRARSGKLVDGSGASCSELEKLITVDKKAVKFEKDKLEAMGDKADPKEKKIVAEAEKAIEKQVAKLRGLQAKKGCE